jgi:hypothetical protein
VFNKNKKVFTRMYSYLMAAPLVMGAAVILGPIIRNRLRYRRNRGVLHGLQKPISASQAPLGSLRSGVSLAYRPDPIVTGAVSRPPVPFNSTGRSSRSA